MLLTVLLSLHCNANLGHFRNPNCISVKPLLAMRALFFRLCTLSCSFGSRMPTWLRFQKKQVHYMSRDARVEAVSIDAMQLRTSLTLEIPNAMQRDR